MVTVSASTKYYHPFVKEQARKKSLHLNLKIRIETKNKLKTHKILYFNKIQTPNFLLYSYEII